MINGGATALSVLTQPFLFNGSPELFMNVRKAVDVPMLMKDIIIDKIQIDAAKKIGADYFLLIQSIFDMSILNDDLLSSHNDLINVCDDYLSFFSESSTISRDFMKNGFNIVDFNSNADIYIINSCSVTDNADKECRRVIRKIKNKNPNSIVGVIGCYAQLKPKYIW